MGGDTDRKLNSSLELKISQGPKIPGAKADLLSQDKSTQEQK